MQYQPKSPYMYYVSMWMRERKKVREREEEIKRTRGGVGCGGEAIHDYGRFKWWLHTS